MAAWSLILILMALYKITSNPKTYVWSPATVSTPFPLMLGSSGDLQSGCDVDLSLLSHVSWCSQGPESRDVWRQTHTLLWGGQQAVVLVQPQALQAAPTERLCLLYPPRPGGQDGPLQAMWICGQIQQPEVHQSYSQVRRPQVKTPLVCFWPYWTEVSVKQ